MTQETDYLQFGDAQPLRITKLRLDWGFDDFEPVVATKMKNCFYVVADRRLENGHEFFKFVKLFILSGFSFSKFLDAMDRGAVVVDFDARTGHNHGTKFRLKQGFWTHIYENELRAI